MPKLSRSVSHQSQRSQADCLPTAVKMVTDYLGLSVSYKTIYTLLDTQWYGTPFRRLERLTALGLSVTIAHLALNELSSYLAQELPVIAGVHTASLPYWTQAVDHVVVVVGVEADAILVHDPSQSNGPKAVPGIAFELAQLEFDNLCAILHV
jgi:ABC-type bacteriocin/lantibiotic exporter with double-glycine peptidase domain